MDKFQAKVSLEVFTPFEDPDAVQFPRQIDLAYELDVAYKSWGIDDVLIILPQSVTVPYTIENGQDGQLLIPLAGVAKELWVGGHGFGVDGLVVTIDQNFKVTQVEAMLSYLDKG